MNEYWSFRLNPLTGWFGIKCSCLTECHSNWEGPCFGMTVQKCPRLGGLCRGWAVPFFRGQTDTTAQQPFVPDLLKRCGLFIVYFLFQFVYSAPVSTSVSFIPLFFPLTMSHHLLSLALFVSWHAEYCQPITDTRCLFIFISKNRKTLQFFILLCAICPRFHITEHDAFNRAVALLLGMCRFYQWVFICPELQLCNNLVVGWLMFYFFPRFIFCFIIFLCLLGNIKNTEPLDSKRQRVHTFWVTAFDCGKNRAQADAQVVVTVKPSCKPGWIGNFSHALLFFWSQNKADETLHIRAL